MAVLTKTKAHSEHWYRADGTPVHTTMKADGSGERPTTLRDARKHGYFPSVTSVLNVLSRPQLESWKLDQVALAALRVKKKTKQESEEYWCTRVRDAAFEQVEQAADLGSMIHGALEKAMVGEPFDRELLPYIQPVLDWRQEVGIDVVACEERVVNLRHGFAGTTDVLFLYGENGIGILDYKTKKTKPGKAVEGYDNQAMQLAAYAATYWGEEQLGRVLAANVFISTTEPGRMDVVKHNDLPVHWAAFKMAAALWRYSKQYDPRHVSRQLIAEGKELPAKPGRRLLAEYCERKALPGKVG